MNVEQLIGLKGGSDATFFEILAIEGEDETSYYPCVIDGKEVRWSEVDFDTYMANKVERKRRTVRLTVVGNPVAAEDVVRGELGCNALSTSPTSIDIYPDEPDPFSTTNAAAELGKITSEARAKASRENGKRGGRPKKVK